MKINKISLLTFIIILLFSTLDNLIAQEQIKFNPYIYQNNLSRIDSTKLKLVFPFFLEAKLFAITKWDAGCPGGQRDWWDDMGDAWYNELTSNWPLYIKDGRYINGNIADSWFTDADIVWWGNDQTYVDEADVCMICLHGDDIDSRWHGSVRINESGPGDCRTSQADMVFGDLDLEFLHLSSCHSLEDNQWFFEWASSFDGLHQVDGFHG